MSNWSARPLDARWMALRKQLQERYAALARLPDASRLAYLRGPLHTVTEEQIAAQWQLAVKSPVSEMPTANNIYIHVPFCKSICSFCNYERLRPSNPAILQVYLDRIEQSMAVLGPAVESIQWGAVYVGGGTPSTLPAAMLDRLFTSLERHFDIDSNAARSFEFDPQVMNTSRVEVLKRHGFSHFSFGIQTLSAGVNQAHNRGPQSRETVAKRFEELYSAGLQTRSSLTSSGCLRPTAPDGSMCFRSVPLLSMCRPTLMETSTASGPTWHRFRRWCRMRWLRLASVSGTR